MTRKWHSSLFVFVLFLVTVYSIQNSISQESSGTVCSKIGYSCTTTSECAERHSGRTLDEVLFHCDGRRKICCPPYYLNKSDESEQLCKRSSCKPNGPNIGNPAAVRPQNNEGASGYNSYDFQNSNHSNVPAESRKPQYEQPQSPHRRPTIPSSQNFGPQNTQVKPQTQQSRPQNAQTLPQNNNYPNPPLPTSESRRPQVEEIPHQRPPISTNHNIRPQSFQPTPQNQSSKPQNQPTRPVGSSPAPPQNFKVPNPLDVPEDFSASQLRSHRNFKLLPSESNCGVNNFANRITEGEEVSLGEYPWMVLTGLKDKNGNYRWNCGGTLISGRYVLTAAHCLIVDNRTIEYVRLGEHNLTNDTDCYKDLCLDQPEDISIEEVIPHEKWNTTTIKNDIALVRLSRNPLTLGKSNIYPICLPLDKTKLNLTSTTKYEVAGWGKTDWNADEGSDVLRKASISGVSYEECNICKGQKKQQYCPIISSQLCVQGWKSVDVCKGDSGGPLMITRLNIYQIGITSFKGSEYCGAENIPSIFTRVESFLPWILDNIRE